MEPSTPTTPSKPVLRDEKGHWLPGTASPNPKGRRSLAAELPFIEGVKQGASAETVAKIIEMLGKYAVEHKNLQAAALYLQYTVPTPARTIVTRGEGLGEIDDETARQIVQDAADYLKEGTEHGNRPD